MSAPSPREQRTLVDAEIVVTNAVSVNVTAALPIS